MGSNNLDMIAVNWQSTIAEGKHLGNPKLYSIMPSVSSWSSYNMVVGIGQVLQVAVSRFLKTNHMAACFMELSHQDLLAGDGGAFRRRIR